MPSAELLTTSERGLFCEAGNFFVDPWQPVDRAVVTHAHGDHVCGGCGTYLTSNEGRDFLQYRLGDVARIDSAAFGERRTINGVTISLHPAGHIRGSAQVRIEHQGQVWCASGDYKLEPDPTCTPFEPVRCHTFITESTFGLPIYRWRPTSEVWADVNDWWRKNVARGRASVLFAYSLGKAQRVLAGVDSSIGPIFCHGAVEAINAIYRANGVNLPTTAHPSSAPGRKSWSDALIVAPPSARGTPWLRRFGEISTGFVSGWMTVRGARRRRSVDRGFPVSDHADWPGLDRAIQETGAQRILVTHGSTAVMTRWLIERGFDAAALRTRYEGELVEESEATEPDNNGAGIGASDDSAESQSALPPTKDDR